MRKLQLLAVSIATMAVLFACSDDDTPTPTPNPTPTPTTNKAAMITDHDKLAMLYSLVDLEGDKGRIYEMTYTADYKLDEALDFEINSTNKLKMFVAQYLLDAVPSAKSVNLSFDAGCSAFACPDKSAGEYLMSRNFDFNHLDATTKELYRPTGGRQEKNLHYRCHAHAS